MKENKHKSYYNHELSSIKKYSNSYEAKQEMHFQLNTFKEISKEDVKLTIPQMFPEMDSIFVIIDRF